MKTSQFFFFAAAVFSAGCSVNLGGFDGSPDASGSPLETTLADGGTSTTPSLEPPSDGDAGIGVGGDGSGGAADAGGGSLGAASDAGGDTDEPVLVTDPSCGFDSENTGVELVVDNLQTGQAVPHQLVMLVGRTGAAVESITTVHGSRVLEVPVREGKFKAFAVLEPGVNYVGLSANGHRSKCFEVSFKEPDNEYQVRYFSFTAKDSRDDRFIWLPQNAQPNNRYGCLDDDPCGARAIADRMRFMALVNQLEMAETLVASGGPRETFTLSRDDQGRVVDPLFVSERTVEELRQDAAEHTPDPGSFGLMRTAGEEIEARERDVGAAPQKLKHVMVFRDIQAGAWGGGSRASLGAGTFHSFPADVAELYDRLFDERDPTQSGADWSENSTVSRSFTNASGALVHELGHTFGLQHNAVPDPSCGPIMSGGFRIYHELLLPGLEPTMCWSRNSGNSISDHRSHVENSPWIKGVTP